MKLVSKHIIKAVLIISIGIISLSFGYYIINDRKKYIYNNKIESNLAEKRDTVVYDELEKMTTDDGIVYYIYTYSGKKGILDKEKCILINANYDVVSYNEHLDLYEVANKVDNDYYIGYYSINGNELIDVNDGVVLFYKIDIDNNRYYFEAHYADERMAIYDSKIIQRIKPIHEKIDYVGDEDCDVESFRGNYDGGSSFELLYCFIDQNNEFKKLEDCIWERRYKVIKYDKNAYDKLEKYSQVRMYNKYMIIDLFIYTYDDSNDRYFRKETYDDSTNFTYCYFDDDYNFRMILDNDSYLSYNVIEEGKRKGKTSNITLTSDKGHKHIKERTINNIEPSTPYYNYSDNNSEFNREPLCQMCRACKGTGDCPVCNGMKRTKTKLFYNYEKGYNDLDWEVCKSCQGSGKHRECGGDGWLEEGKDF